MSLHQSAYRAEDADERLFELFTKSGELLPYFRNFFFQLETSFSRLDKRSSAEDFT